MSDMQNGVIVTGGSRGLGLGLVLKLLAEGYRVATCSRKPTGAIEELQAEYRNREKFFWAPCVLGSEDGEARFFGQACEWLGTGSLYGLVNNAAIAGEGILATFPTVNIASILEVNLFCALRMSRLASRVLLAQNRSGRVINISSIVGQRGYTGLTAYAASKAGLDGLTRALAREIGRRGITVNSLAPGYLDTDLSASLNQQQRQQILNRTPLGRLGQVADVVPLITFLLGPGGSFITGQTFVVDGGLSC
jgi:3-oxoacyl-[acyl-carrier protein] reductase